MLRSVATVLAGSALAASEYTYEQSFTDVITEYHAANTITDPVFVAGNTADNTVSIMVNTYPNQMENELVVVQTLEDPGDNGGGFGRQVDMAGDTRTGNFIYAASLEKAYVYTESKDSRFASLAQTLQPADDGVNALAERWGESVTVDRSTLNTAAVGCSDCHFCDPSNDDCEDPTLPVGSISIFEASPKKRMWSETQTLYPSYTGPLSGCATGVVPGVFRAGEHLRIDGDVLVATASYTFCQTNGGIIFTKEKDLWSEQQILHADQREIYRFDVDDDTIMLTHNNLQVDGEDDAGGVSVLYPDTEDFTGVKPKPKAKPHWSMHQLLLPPNPTAGDEFGTDVSIQGNTAIITSFTDTMYVYERPEKRGSWSLQQVITDGFVENYRDVILEGSKIYAIYKENGVEEVKTNVYTLDEEWDCLVVSVEDQFGDGWDGAQLEITSPNGQKATYAPVCMPMDNMDSWQFRFCPRMAEDRGLYKMAIVDAPKSKFFWEIQWRVFEEATGAWFQGNHATRMDFDFNSEKLSFTRRAITHDLDTNITCHKCAPKPPAPKPKPKRSLKGSTHAPTISPAPTLAQTENYDNWQYLEMSGADWFDTQHKGINYYISDIGGHHLVSAGTKCHSEPEMCWQNLPDGEYILRITGNLNKNRDTAGWAFCGRVGAYGTQLDFSIKNGECDALASYTREQYCVDELDAMIITTMEFALTGVSETSALSDLTAADHLSFQQGLAGLLPSSVSPSDVKIVSMHMVEGLSVLKVTVSADAIKAHVDPRDMLAIEEFEKLMTESIVEHAKSGNLWNSISLTTTQGSSFFHQVTGATVRSCELEWVEVEQVHGSNEAEVQTNADSYYKSAFLKGGFTVESIAASLGYIFAAVAFLAVVGAIVSSRMSPREYDNVDTTMSAAASELESAPKRKPIAASEHGARKVDATKKSVALNALMMADLVQMTKSEEDKLGGDFRL